MTPLEGVNQYEWNLILRGKGERPQPVSKQSKPEDKKANN